MVIKVTSFEHEFSKKSQNVTKDEKLVKVCLDSSSLQLDEFC